MEKKTELESQETVLLLPVLLLPENLVNEATENRCIARRQPDLEFTCGLAFIVY